jgi:hypothetical protein
MTYIPGDFWRICEVCGFEYRASQTKKRWDGLITCFADWEERHPQDFVRGRVDRQNVPDPRPEQIDVLIGPLSTTVAVAVSAGATIISVASSVRFLPSDQVGVMLDSGDVCRAVLLGVPDSTSIQLTSPLPGSASVGRLVINYSAVSEPDIG